MSVSRVDAVSVPWTFALPVRAELVRRALPLYTGRMDEDDSAGEGGQPSRGGVGAELAVPAALAVAFLLVFPERPGYVDALLAAAAVVLIGAAHRRSRRLWALQPSPPEGYRERLAAASLRALAFTVPVVALFFVAGLLAGLADGDWSGALERVGNRNLAVALALYLPWALLQQIVFQLYLLGRLLFLLPPRAAVALTAAAFSLVHYPRAPIMALTLVAGGVWAVLYRRYRTLLPVAASHALLAATLHYWVFGRDLLAAWLAGG